MHKGSRCTVQQKDGSFCDLLSMEDVPFPICTRHAHALLAHMIVTVNERLTSGSRIRAAVHEPTPQEFSEGIIYYVLIDGMVKIGWTGHVSSRMRSYPPSAVLLATEVGSRLDEVQRHEQFAEYRVARKEWFTPGPKLRTHIEGLGTYQAA